jgi:ferredoxin
MTIKEVFEKFEKLHSYSFATIDGDYPEIRIAHFLTYDDDGLYFQTMKVKPFYSQLSKSGKVAVCALIAKDGEATHDDEGLSDFPPGFFIRVSGDVKELSMEELKSKTKTDARFLPLVKDIDRYPTMTTFVLHSFKGEVYDYDFDCENRDHKIERERFSFGGRQHLQAGFHINSEKCIACGACAKVCTFSAISPGETYSINPNRCDECGSCYSACPVNAITAKSPMEETYRKACGKKIIAYTKTKEIH